MTQTRGPRENI